MSLCGLLLMLAADTQLVLAKDADTEGNAGVPQAGFRSMWGTLSKPPARTPDEVWGGMSVTVQQPCPAKHARHIKADQRTVCGISTFSPCVVFSFGSNGDFNFEKKILKLNPLCRVHIFDPTSRANGKSTLTQRGISFHDVGLAHFDGMGEIPVPLFKAPLVFPMKTLPSIMRGLQIEHVHVLKIDSSGEFEVFHQLNASGFDIGAAFDHILLEVHLYHPSGWAGNLQRCCYGADDLEHLFSIFRVHGFVLTAKELVGQKSAGAKAASRRISQPNSGTWSASWGDYSGIKAPDPAKGDYCCAEVALVHRRLLDRLARPRHRTEHQG